MVDRAFGIITAFIGLTALAVIISRRSNTAKVLDALLGGLNKLQETAIKPVMR